MLPPSSTIASKFFELVLPGTADESASQSSGTPGSTGKPEEPHELLSILDHGDVHDLDSDEDEAPTTISVTVFILSFVTFLI